MGFVLPDPTADVKLLVIGGNGFLGRRVCRHAVRDGHDVTSVARSGTPPADHLAPWTNRVEWVGADVFAPHEWRDSLEGVDAVVHSIGTISESPTDGVTFERINGDAGIVAALEADRAGVDRFVYLSSSTTPPFVRAAYLEAKRRAEAAIADLDLETTVLRPGPVYGPAQPHFPRVANWLFAAVGTLEPLAARMGADRPLSVETVGRATYAAALGRVDDDFLDGPTIAAAFGR